MIAFDVKDMTCGHCASTITQALKAVDRDAQVNIDLARHRVVIQPVSADAHQLQEAIAEAGYTPTPAEAHAGEMAAKGRSCCGGCH